MNAGAHPRPGLVPESKRPDGWRPPDYKSDDLTLVKIWYTVTGMVSSLPVVLQIVLFIVFFYIGFFVISAFSWAMCRILSIDVGWGKVFAYFFPFLVLGIVWWRHWRTSGSKSDTIRTSGFFK